MRAIGTNAVPWLLEAIHQPYGEAWLRSKVNQVLGKQNLTRYRLPPRDPRMRGEVGFRALGELGESAIPAILALVEKETLYVETLAAIGRPAIPALQNCLTNTSLSTNTPGNRNIVPAHTIAAVFNAGTVGSLTFTDIMILIPSIKAWAEQSTNHPAQHNAAFVLDQLGLRE